MTLDPAFLSEARRSSSTKSTDRPAPAGIVFHAALVERQPAL